MILEHGAFPADIGELIGPRKVEDYSEWANMVDRWATDFVDKARTWSSTDTRKALGI